MIEFTQEKFSGPLGLLLSLIESEEMDITEINLAKIADEYVLYIRSLADINPEELADFLVVAAKLLFIKSKALLPYLYADSEEDDSGDLEKQLRMYKEFVEASQKIKTIIENDNFLFVPPLVKSRRISSNLPAFSPPPKVTAPVLHEQFKKILAMLVKRTEQKLPEQNLEPKMNIEEKIALIRELLLNKIKINFSKLLATAENKTEMIVSFLAVLELAKQRELIFDQDELFSEIHISST
ncbi:MAG: segregation/condensation protein A [Patescibacteria group bacterium]|jgi:segregation and condensation protein A